LKKEQERKAAERRRIIEERCGKPKNLEDASEDDLKEVCQQYFDRVLLCEGQKWDLEYEVRRRDYEINELNIQVNDLRGKFVKPALKKVSKYDTKFKKLQEKTEEKVDFRGALKSVKKDITEELTKVPAKSEKAPDWAKKVKGTAEVAATGDAEAAEE